MAIKKEARSIGGDPYLSFRFKVEIDGIEAAGFQEVTGLTAETEVESFREGGVNTSEIQLTGPTKFPSKLILKRGLADEADLWDWYKDIVAGNVARKGVAVVLHDLSGEEQWRWSFRDACPVKWIGPNMRADRGEVAFESIELIHGGFLYF